MNLTANKAAFQAKTIHETADSLTLKVGLKLLTIYQITKVL